MHVMFLILMISLVAGAFDPGAHITSFPTHVVVGHPTKKIISIEGSEGIQKLADGWFSLGGTLTPDTELTITWEDGSETYKVRDLVREDFLVHWKFGTHADDLFVPTSRRGEVLVKFHGELTYSLGFFSKEGYTHWYFANQFDIQTALMEAQKRVMLVMQKQKQLTYTFPLSEMNLLEEGFHSETVQSAEGEQFQITVICDELEPYPEESRTLILFTGMGVTSVTGLPNIDIKEDWVELDQAFIAAVDEVELTVVGDIKQTYKLESWKLLLEGSYEVGALVGTEEVKVVVIGGKQVYPLRPLIYTPASTPGSTRIEDDSVNKIEIRASVEGHQVTQIAIEREELRHFPGMAGLTYTVRRPQYSADGDTLSLDYLDIWETNILVVKVTYDKGIQSISPVKVTMSTLLLNQKTTFEPAGSPAITLTTKVNLEKVTYLCVTSKKELSNSQLATTVTNYPVGTSMTRIGLGSTPVFAPVRFLRGKLSECAAAGNGLVAEMSPNDGVSAGQSQPGSQQPCIILNPRQMTKTYVDSTGEFHFHTISSRPPLKYLRKRGLWVHFVTADGEDNHVTKRVRKWIGNHARFTIRELGNELGSQKELGELPKDPDLSIGTPAPSKGFVEPLMDNLPWRKTLGDIHIHVYTTCGVENDVASVLALDPFAHFIVLDSQETPAEMPLETNVFTYDILPVHGLGFGEPSLTPEQSMQQEAFRGVFLGKLEKHVADLGSRNYPKRARRRVRKLGG